MLLSRDGGAMDIRELRRAIRGEVFTDLDTIEHVRTDFGRVIQKTPSAVVLPADERDVQRSIRFAFDHDWQLSTRGAGHSQGGQGLNHGGLLLDCGSLSEIGAIEDETVWVQGGATWRQVVERTLESGLAPPVLTNNLDVSVAGSISTGGLGVASHRFGTQIEHVMELEVVTGEGHRVRCSAEENVELFRCALGGLGQFGVITAVRLRLRKIQPRVRTHYLLYDSLPALMGDCAYWLESGRIDFFECWCAPCRQGLRMVGETRLPFAEWFYPVQISMEYGRHSEHLNLPSGLHSYRELGHDNFTLEQFIFRSENLFDLWKQGGTWGMAHPWMEVFLPWDKAAAYVQGVLRSFPSTLLEGGQVALWPLKPGGTMAPLLKMPASELVMVFALQPAVGQQTLPRVLPMLNKASQLSGQIGGKRYLSGWIDFDQNAWKSHFGEIWPSLLEWKRFYDPKGILNHGFIDFGGQESEG